MTASTAAVETRGLSFDINGKSIIRGIDFQAPEGDLVGVIGPNGAGKTTLLRLVCGLLQPTAGRVFLGGRPVAAMRHGERARAVSYMGQDDVADAGFSVMEILLMGRYPHIGALGRETETDRETALRMLSYVGLAGFENRRFGGLSGGERQLVLFAKILVQNTTIVVLDEPSSHLDIRHEDCIFSMAQELAREGRTVLASVHNLNVAAHYCTSLMLMDRGGMAARGAPAAVLEPSLLERVYGVRTAVSRSAGTGSITVGVVPPRAPRAGTRVHVIGGAGSAVNLTRELYRLGFEVTGGIAHAYDSDESLWKTLGIPHVAVEAFSRIEDRDVRKAEEMVRAADVAVLCAFPVGMGNIANLRLAETARRLVILLPGAGDMQRSFFTPEARTAFEALASRARLSTHEELFGMLTKEKRAE